MVFYFEFCASSVNVRSSFPWNWGKNIFCDLWKEEIVQWLIDI